MAPCDLCGKDAPLVTIRIEGAELAVCSGCGKHGTIISRPAAVRRSSPSFSVVEKEERVIADYAEKIRTARQRLQMEQKAFAEHLQVKESVLHQLELGSLVPPVDLARKIGRILRLSLVEQGTSPPSPADHLPKKGTGEATLGDLVTIRKRKGS